ncbi:marine proteobacterial sortase target protein [Phreatobacter stygius]|uniref:Marine proteobacterial sortase target protein n=1 Tax=Phreatobacter stygius TaxID=1940610 RepID=A0A4D7AYN7_9HYPH|nr:marine proteobacterial sortase target protein [Phreatobacter stygius]QCI66439.1 marine proteobacterial sortase target protein [Phreatobacter stygius]
MSRSIRRPPSAGAICPSPLAARLEQLSKLVLRTLLALFGLLALVGLGRAGETPTPSAMQSGGLLMRNAQAPGFTEALRLGTDVHLAVSGPTVRGRITQVFRNPTDRWVEAVYVFPLPEDGAVDYLKMIVGDRVIIGEIKPRAEARAVYEAARSQGRRAGLVEQQRPNLFTNAVANIGPGETVLVQIEYQAPVRQSTGVYSLRVPLVMGARYNPAGGADGVDPVPNQAAMAAPVLDPRRYDRVNPVSIRVNLQPGFQLGEVKSAYHAVVDRPDGAGRFVMLTDGEVPADRDFELTWTAAPFDAPQARLFRERIGGEDYLLAFLTPPSQNAATPELSREIVFVIDNSGSMSGASMRQAKESLLYALARLKAGDRFNVIRFDDTLTKLFPDTVAADAEHVGIARNFVSGLQARGGTEMVPALRAALEDPRPDDASRVRQVVFLTDGAIGNDQQLIDTIARERGRSRLFMVGIGSAPNNFLMTRGAEMGRGTYTHIGSVNEVETRMRELFGKLERPVVTDLTARIEATTADMTPGSMPDLYSGEPVVLAMKVAALGGTVHIEGRIGGQPWRVALPVDQAIEGRGLSKLWARRKISDVEAERSLRRITGETADARILQLALAHSLVSSQTSLVAVDRTPARPIGAPLTRHDLPLNLPAGWDFNRLFGATARATGVGSTSMPAETAGSVGTSQASGHSVTLPRTATDAGVRLIAGAGCLMLGAMELLLPRRRRVTA